MKKVGFVDYYLDEWHANNYPEWIEKANGDFKVAYAWAEIEHSLATGASTDEWCERMNIQRIDTIEELCEKSDYIVVLAPSDPEKHLEYAKKVLSYGKPAYIDKTFAPDSATALKIFELSEKYNAPIFSTSALRYAQELKDLKGIKNMIITGGGSNFDEYIIHTAEMARILLDEDAKNVTVQKLGDQRIVNIETENNKATIIFTPCADFAVYGELDSKPVKCQITSAFFEGLIQDMVKFFIDKDPPVTKEQTMAVMELRTEILKNE
jgi:hypothetical protein